MTLLSYHLDIFRPLYQASDPIHDFEHVLRVTKVGEFLAQAEGADRETVRLAALLHDVPSDMHNRSTHEEGAAQAAIALLSAHKQPPALIQKVVHCIRNHRFRRSTELPLSLEAQCLYDADKLDVLGAIGVARAFGFAGLHGHPLWDSEACDPADTPGAPESWSNTPAREWQIKLRHLAARMHTPTGRRLAQVRHRVMADLFVQLHREWSLSDLELEQEQSI